MGRLIDGDKLIEDLRRYRHENISVDGLEGIIALMPSAEPNLQPTCNQLATDCISRKDAIDIASGYCHPANIAKELMKLPSAEKTGKWNEFDSDEERYDVIKCSYCKHIFTVDSYHWTDIGFVKDDFKFCPNCGAKMEA